MNEWLDAIIGLCAAIFITCIFVQVVTRIVLDTKEIRECNMAAKNKYEEQNANFLANLLAQNNLNPDEQFPSDRDESDAPQAVISRGQAVVDVLANPRGKKNVIICKHCRNPFTSNYKEVSFCSTHCTVWFLKDKYKLAWRPSKNIRKEEWEIREYPKKVPYAAMVAMKTFLIDVEKQLGRSIPVESGEWDESLPPVTQEELKEKGWNSGLSEPDSSLPPTQVLQLDSLHNPEPKAQSEQSEKDLEDWLFGE